MFMAGQSLLNASLPRSTLSQRIITSVRSLSDSFMSLAAIDEALGVDSMHCYFVLAGNPDIPVIYAVEHVREGRSFATRTVQARQRGRPIFTTTLSFVREGSAGKQTLAHDTPLPPAPDPEPSSGDPSEDKMRTGHGPMESQHYATIEASDGAQHSVRTRNWIRARGSISANGGHQAHLNALAYMTDSFFIGTVGRAHKTWRPPPSRKAAPSDEAHQIMKERFKAQNDGLEENKLGRPEIGMMVSLDHTIYFHRPQEFRADEWLYSETNSPWAGDGRGLVTQKIWTREGKLVATCFQEGLVRLKQVEGQSKL